MRKLIIAGTAVLAVFAPHAVSGLTATAAAVQHGRVVSADPVDWTPHILDGKVRGIATVGSTTVAVGDFTKVREQGSSTVLTRSRILAFDSEGKISTTFNPTVVGSEVFDVVPSGDGTSVYVAGSFSSINDTRRTARVARIDVTTGAVISSFRAPAFNNKATALDLVGDKLYVSGWFTRVGGADRTLVTALDPTTGADLNTVNLTFRDTWNGGTLGVEEMTVQPDGSDMVVIGNFRTVNGQSRPQVAMIDLTGPAATLDSWATSRYSTSCHRSFETYMWGLDGSPDGTHFAIGTTGAYSGGPSTGTLCDAVARWEWDKPGANQNPTWIAYTGGDTVSDVEVTDSAIYAGGHFRWFNNPYAADAAGPASVRRMGLVALDPRNGLPFSWNPGRARGWGVWGFASTDEGLWVGHDTATVGGETHERLALMPLDAAAGTVPPDNTGSLPADVYLLGQPSGTGFDDRVLQRPFDGSASGATTEVAPGSFSWSSVRGAFMVDGWLYTAWSDGTMKRQPYNGRTFGATRNIDFFNFTAWADEMRTMRSMWFDADTGRLYFTLNGTNRLYYRYFTPESRVVGGIRYEVPTADVDFSKVTGGFLANDKLWYRTDSGVISRADWSNGPVSGTSTTVSGPGVDSVSWDSRTFFLYAN